MQSSLEKDLPRRRVEEESEVILRHLSRVAQAHEDLLVLLLMEHIIFMFQQLLRATTKSSIRMNLSDEDKGVSGC